MHDQRVNVKHKFYNVILCDSATRLHRIGATLILKFNSLIMKSNQSSNHYYGFVYEGGCHYGSPHSWCIDVIYIYSHM